MSTPQRRARAARLKQQRNATRGGGSRPGSANPFARNQMRSPPRKSRPPPTHNVFNTRVTAGPFGGAPIRRTPMNYGHSQQPMMMSNNNGVDSQIVNQLQNEISNLNMTIQNLQESIRNELLGMKTYCDNLNAQIQTLNEEKVQWQKFMSDTGQAWQTQNNSIKQLESNLGVFDNRLSRVESNNNNNNNNNNSNNNGFSSQPPPSQPRQNFEQKYDNDEPQIRDHYEKVAVPSKKVRTVTGRDDDNKLELPGPPNSPPPGAAKSRKKKKDNKRSKNNEPTVDLDEMPVGGSNKNLPPEQPPKEFTNELDELPVGSGGPPPEDVGPVKLKECRNCGRKFKPEALARHLKNKVCKKKKRKAFKVKVVDEEIPEDAKRQAKIAEKKLAKAKKQAKWRQDRNALRDAIRAGKQIAKAMKDGVDISSLPPPPSSSAKQDDRVPCPHCGRKFNEDVAARHVPKCNSRNKKKR